MLIRELLVCVFGLMFGAAAAAGAFALVTGIGVVSRMAGKTATAKHVFMYENSLIAGAIIGNVFSAMEMISLSALLAGAWVSVAIKMGILVLAGIAAGCFIGCLATALAEVLQVFPLLFRRAGLKEGLNISMLFFAAGKVVGALYGFLFVKQV